jgi:cysteine-rich repeat protein
MRAFLLVCLVAGCGGGVSSDPHEIGPTAIDAGAVCGNALVDPGEVCDDGNTKSGDGCSADCKSLEVCGNGIIDPGEQCDDGNTVDGDGCSHACQLETITPVTSSVPKRNAGPNSRS